MPSCADSDIFSSFICPGSSNRLLILIHKHVVDVEELTGKESWQLQPQYSCLRPQQPSILEFPKAMNCTSSTSQAMLLPRLQPPLRAALTSIARSTASGSQTTCLNEAFAQLAIKSSRRTTGAGLTSVRHASHKAQGAVNKAKDGPGKRLGAKKSGGTHIPAGD